MKYVHTHLCTLSGEMMHAYLFGTALPETAEKIQEECRMGKNYPVKDFLKDNGILTLVPQTVTRWLNHLGFKYSPFRKSYYVDSHESLENVLYHSKFISRYQQYERKCHRWIHIPLQRYEKMVKDGELVEEAGFRFEKEGQTYMELHVDDSPRFQDECNHLPFGGHLSICKGAEEKPMILLGQDKCIFKQFSLTKKFWSDPDRT
jgi:hypothetical protein